MDLPVFTFERRSTLFIHSVIYLQWTVHAVDFRSGLDNLCSIYNINQTDISRSCRELAAHDGYLSCCRFVDESTILTSSGDQTCILWDIELGKQKQIFTEHDGDVMSVAVKSDGDPNIFVSGSCDSTARVWDARTGTNSQMILRGHQSDINAVSLFSDGFAVGTGSDDSTCRFFDLRACEQIIEFKNDGVLCGITSVTFSQSGRILFAGYDDYNCLGWDVLGSTSQHAIQLTGHENRVSCIGLSPDGDALCTGSWDTYLKIWA
jgi:guanine nucleotide-binding protein G(I)/G(S)/G(T) subunit beta-1